MPELFGARYQRAELLRRIGRLEQVAGVRLVTIGDGQGRGVRVLEFRTGTGFAFDVLVDRSFDVGRSERVVKAAGDDHAAAPGPEPAPSVRVVVPGGDHPGGRQPAERLPSELAPADVEAAVNKHVERESSAGTELQYPDTPSLAVADGH